MTIFTLSNVSELIESFGASSKAYDCLIPFLAKFDFEDIYKTEDDSIIFAAGGRDDVSIEFFDFENPLTRTINIMYYENGDHVMLPQEKLIRL